MITYILVLYWVFNVLFIIGYINTDSENIIFNFVTHIIDLLLSPIMFPVILGHFYERIYY